MSPESRLDAAAVLSSAETRRRELRLRLTALLALLAIGAGAAVLLPPSDGSTELLGDEALGTIALRTIRAARPLLVPDPEATEARREAVAAAVRPVALWDRSIATQWDERLQAAFEGARATREGVGSTSAVTAQARAAFAASLGAELPSDALEAASQLQFSSALEESTRTVLRIVHAGPVPLSRPVGTSTLIVRTARPSDTAGELDERAWETSQLLDVAAWRRQLAAWGERGRDDPAQGASLPVIADEAIRRAAARLASVLLAPTLRDDPAATRQRREQARASVAPVVHPYARGERIVAEGERIASHHLQVFRHVREQARLLDGVAVRLGAALLAGLLSYGVFRLARRTMRGFRPTRRDLLFLSFVLLGQLGLLRLSLAVLELLRERMTLPAAEASLLLLPLAAGTVLVRLLRSGESSIAFAMVLAPLAALQLGALVPVVTGLVAGLIAAGRIGRHPGRTELPLASLQSGVAAAATVLAFALFTGEGALDDTPQRMALALLGAGVIAPLCAGAAAPVCEWLFGYVSEGRLEQLANLNHPLLKELFIRAPGTYRHSLLVGQLAEAAARRVGAHPLLARVGGYFHDLGKLSQPHFFDENQRGLPASDAADDTAASLRRHVEDGLERGRQSRLPAIVLELMAQHHGDRRVGAFGPETVPSDGRRYPGPRPVRREAALLMLADAVEAASRGLVEPTEERLRTMTTRVVEAIILEGQLDDCDLSLAEVREATQALAETLIALQVPGAGAASSRVDAAGGSPTLESLSG